MIRCAVSRGSKAAGRLAAARRYNSNSTISIPNDAKDKNSPDSESSSIDDFFANEIPYATPRVVDKPPPRSLAQKLESQSEAGTPVPFHTFKRLNISPSNRMPFKRIKLRNDQKPAKTEHESSSAPLSQHRRPFEQPPHLPMSPLMDPAFTLARSKHRLPKARPIAETLTPFSKQLQYNPYALALATPVRSCNVTRVTMPNFFLQDYNLLRGPGNDDGVWWMPGGLLKKGREGLKIGLEGDVMSADLGEVGLEGADPDLQTKKMDGGGLKERHTQVEELGLQEQEGLNVTRVEEETISTSLDVGREGHTGELTKGDVLGVAEPAPYPPTRLLGPTVYTLARKELLYALTNKKKIGYSSDFQKHFVDSQLLKNAASRHLFSKAHFRADVDEFILERMRRRIAEGITALFRAKIGYIVGCKDWEDAVKKPQTGAYLWTGSQKEDEGEISPPEFATVDRGVTKNQKIPVYNLKVLLGRGKLEELRKECGGGHGMWVNDVLALRHRRRTVDVQLRLWKLQGYLAEYRDIPGFEVE